MPGLLLSFIEGVFEGGLSSPYNYPSEVLKYIPCCSVPYDNFVHGCSAMCNSNTFNMSIG